MIIIDYHWLSKSGKLLIHWLSDNLKSRDASASKSESKDGKISFDSNLGTMWKLCSSCWATFTMEKQRETTQWTNTITAVLIVSGFLASRKYFICFPSRNLQGMETINYISSDFQVEKTLFAKSLPAATFSQNFPFSSFSTASKMKLTLWVQGNKSADK